MIKKVNNMQTKYGMLLGATLLIAFTTMACTNSEKEVPTTPMTRAAANPSVAQAAKNPCNPRVAKVARENPANPCAAKTNPCNPCAAKNPYNPYGAGGQVDPKLVTRPAGSRPYQGNLAALLQEGERLWNDRALGTNSLACGICHLNNANFNPSFVNPYPHPVAMTQQMAGLSQVSLEEMVQFCMVQPMVAQPLPWDSRELAALTAYTHQVQRGFIDAVAANPDLLKLRIANPCNPCSTKKK